MELMFFNVLLCVLLTVTAGFLSPSDSVHRYATHLFATKTQPLEQLKVAVVGGGPSGLLLAHKLLANGASVDIYEGRRDPRLSNDLEGRAYALGLGMRGRTAIRSVDDALWEAVKARGYESERFTLYIRGFPIRLRDKVVDGDGSLEPSVLMYQSDLCAALLDDLVKRDVEGKLSVKFEQRIESCDLKGKFLNLANNIRSDPFDVIIGCDGVNSVVRSSIAAASTAFEVEKTILPGEFKACRLATAPEKLDPTSVALVIPNSGSTTCFVEPTADGSCLLFAGRGGKDDPIMNPSANLTVTAEALKESFPILEGTDFDELARQLANQPAGSASSVRCNVYHYGHAAALCGDAAHATGGVSGQGVNSALFDSVVLAEALEESFDPLNKDASLQKCFLKYSQRQVPEGKALYDLSFGPNPRGLLKLNFFARTALDTLFQGRFGIGQAPLQTMLTTSTIPFSEVRRERGEFYDEPFPDQAMFDDMLAKIYN